MYPDPATAPTPIVTGQNATPKIPVAKAPADWRYAKIDPASTATIADWAPAATVPTATPPDVKPTADKAAVLPTPAAVPPPTRLAAAVYPTASLRQSR